ncbi:hypothetical protein Q1695_005308 [Nippostrongylus brasiliensis]|nr:hypothetical protein Q1695_005308 [Nippostrongylus brasiliensis]
MSSLLNKVFSSDSSESEEDEETDMQPSGSGDGQSTSSGGQTAPVEVKSEEVEAYPAEQEQMDCAPVNPSLVVKLTPVKKYDGVMKGSVGQKCKKVSLIDATQSERYRLRKSGEEDTADELYSKRDLIAKHLANADEIVFDKKKDVTEHLRAFIEERFLMYFGPNDEGFVRELSAEEEEEQQFLIDNSRFLSRVILRMNNFDPDKYNDRLQNYHMMAKDSVFQMKRAMRDKELDEMNKIRQDMFRRMREERMQRIRDGEESSDDDLDDVDDEEQARRRLEEDFEEMLVSFAKNMEVEAPEGRLLGQIRQRLEEMHIGSMHPERERCPSPPRAPAQDWSVEEQVAELPWTSEEKVDQSELLEEYLEPVDKQGNEDKIDVQEIVTYDWAKPLFTEPDEAVTVGEKRSFDFFDDDILPKRRAVENNGTVEQRAMDTTPPPPKSCLRRTGQLLTDMDQFAMTEKERIKWREELERYCSKKKRVRFKEFDDAENRCRFYSRPLDYDGMIRNAQALLNQLRDACPEALYAEYPLVRAHTLIRNGMCRRVPEAASNSHNPDQFIERLSTLKNGSCSVSTYKLLHPPNFLRTDIRESKVPSGIHLPVVPGKRVLQVMPMSRELRAYLLSRFRVDMRACREDRAGISLVRHMDAPVMVAGILFLSDSLMQVVAPEKLTNTVLQCFESTQGVEDILAVIERCSYDELDIRHCVITWGHDLVVYHRRDAVLAAARSLAVFFHVHAAFERKRKMFEQEGYRRRKPPQFWILTIPEVGDFAPSFKIVNGIIRSLFIDHAYFRVLDWAAETELYKEERRKSPYTKAAVESRLTQLFDLCRRELDLTYFRYNDQKLRERKISYERLDYDEG